MGKFLFTFSFRLIEIKPFFILLNLLCWEKKKKKTFLRSEGSAGQLYPSSILIYLFSLIMVALTVPKWDVLSYVVLSR